MLYDQLTLKQKWDLSGVALSYGLLAFSLPLALAFDLPLWPSAIFELLTSFCFYRLAKAERSYFDFPWVLLAIGCSVAAPGAQMLAVPALFHLPVLKKIWSYHQWVSNRLQLMAGATILILVTHTISCGWLLIQPPAIESAIDRYVWGFYWTVTTLATVGYGDITPQSTLARCYAMAIMMLGISSFALIVSHFSRLLIARDGKLEAQKLKFKQLQEIFTRNNVPFRMRNDIFHVYQHILNHKSFEEEEKILEELPKAMRESLQIHIRASSISKIAFFQGLSRKCLEKIAEKFEEKYFDVDEGIVRQGDLGRELFVIHHGAVDVLRDGQKISQLQQGAVFGEMSLVEKTPRNADVIAHKFSHVLVLSYESYLEVVEHYPEFAHKLEGVASERKKAA
jgi:voltage-gated potassium channel